MIDYKTVGLRIRAVRQEKKLTQEKLAEAAGVGVTHISHIETGNSIPSLQVTVDIVNALGCSMDELLCMDVERARSVRDNWLGELVADCSDQEVKLITDMVLALKTSLRRLKLTERYLTFYAEYPLIFPNTLIARKYGKRGRPSAWTAPLF